MPILVILLSWLIFYMQFSLTVYTDQLEIYDQWQNATRQSFDSYMGAYSFDDSLPPDTFPVDSTARITYYMIFIF